MLKSFSRNVFLASGCSHNAHFRVGRGEPGDLMLRHSKPIKRRILEALRFGLPRYRSKEMKILNISFPQVEIKLIGLWPCATTGLTIELAKTLVSNVWNYL